MLALATLTALSVGSAATASDAPLQHALRAARCLSSSVRQVAKHSHVVVYEASCSAPAARVMTFSCDRVSCRADEPEEDAPS